MTADAVGGVWTYALDLAAALRDRDVEVTLAVMGPAMTAQLPRRRRSSQWLLARRAPMAGAGAGGRPFVRPHLVAWSARGGCTAHLDAIRPQSREGARLCDDGCRNDIRAFGRDEAGIQVRGAVLGHSQRVGACWPVTEVMVQKEPFVFAVGRLSDQTRKYRGSV